MIPTYHIRLSQRVSNQLEEIFAFIAQDSPQNASGLVGQILKTIDSLRTFPNRHPLARSGDGSRKVVCGSYLIFFEVDEQRQAVHVIRVVHGARRTA